MLEVLLTRPSGHTTHPQPPIPMKNTLKFVAALALVGFCFTANAQEGEKMAKKEGKMEKKEGKDMKEHGMKKEGKMVKEDGKMVKDEKKAKM